MLESESLFDLLEDEQPEPPPQPERQPLEICALCERVATESVPYQGVVLRLCYMCAKDARATETEEEAEFWIQGLPGGCSDEQAAVFQIKRDKRAYEETGEQFYLDRLEQRRKDMRA